MAHYAPCYDPPLVKDLEAEREGMWASHDRDLFLHVGHFIAWYASAELGITALLQHFTGDQHPTHFHILTRGMDAKVKAERLKEAIEAAGSAMDPGLVKRFEHFTKRIAGLRNKIVHSHLYWPDGDTLQMASIGKPPHYAVDPIANAPKPDMIEGMELFERGLWLRAFATDLFTIVEWLNQHPGGRGIVGRERYQSSLPTGYRPCPEKEARRAKADKRPQTESGSK